MRSGELFSRYQKLSSNMAFDKKIKGYDMRTAIILAAYNEGNNIASVLGKMVEYRERTIIVDDGSTDNTYTTIKDLKFYCIRHKENLGLSKSIYDGIIYAKEHAYDSVIIMDADGQHDPSFIPRFEEALKKYTFVSGNRFWSFEGIPTNKIASNAMGAIVVSQKYSLNFFDVSCGYKAFYISDELLSVIKKSSAYSFVFNVLFYFCSRKASIGSVNIDCIYPASKLYYTKCSEMLSFLESIEVSGMASDLSEELIRVKNLIYRKKDFEIRLQGIKFYGFYIENYAGYILQTDFSKLKKWIKGHNF